MEDILQVMEHFKTAVISCCLQQVILVEKQKYVFLHYAAVFMGFADCHHEYHGSPLENKEMKDRIASKASWRILLH